MKTCLMWLLILVVEGDLQEHTNYPTRKACMESGARFVERTLMDAEDAPLDGFFCEEEKPEKVAAVCQAKVDTCA
jgi:hypothetical protein